LAERTVGAIGWGLRENVRRELQGAQESGNKEESQFQFHLFGL
jgi:hypothetical protein